MLRKVIGGYLFKCDRCGEWHSADAKSEAEAIKDAESFGWKIGKKHLCDICGRRDSDGRLPRVRV